MRLEPDWAAAGYRPGSPRQRVTSGLLSAGVILLVLLAAIYGSGVVQKTETRDNPVTFDVSDQNRDKGAEKQQKRAERKQKPKSKPKPKQARQKQVKPPVVEPSAEPPVEKKPAYTFLKVSREDFSASDVGKMKSPGLAQSSPPASGGGGAASGGGGTVGPGEGPGGAVLYRAAWHREPTNAELGGYLPAGAPPSGWGEIACQTVEGYRVENCRILAESPRGSGFGRAVQDAAWQFQVLPPRINGKPQIGAWVRIRIDYGTRAG